MPTAYNISPAKPLNISPVLPDARNRSSSISRLPPRIPPGYPRRSLKVSREQEFTVISFVWSMTLCVRYGWRSGKADSWRIPSSFSTATTARAGIRKISKRQATGQMLISQARSPISGKVATASPSLSPGLSR